MTLNKYFPTGVHPKSTLKQFLKFSKKQSLDDLLILSKDDIDRLITNYFEVLILFNTPLTMEQKVWYINAFYGVNGIEINYYNFLRQIWRESDPEREFSMY